MPCISSPGFGDGWNNFHNCGSKQFWKLWNANFELCCHPSHHRDGYVAMAGIESTGLSWPRPPAGSRFYWAFSCHSPPSPEQCNALLCSKLKALNCTFLRGLCCTSSCLTSKGGHLLVYNNLQTALHISEIILLNLWYFEMVLLVFRGGCISWLLYLPLVMYLLQSKMLLMSCHSICTQRCVGSHMCYSNFKPLSTFHIGALFCLFIRCQTSKLGDNLVTTCAIQTTFYLSYGRRLVLPFQQMSNLSTFWSHLHKC